MCLIAFALNAHPDWPLLLLANRDEFHDRPARPSQWWNPGHPAGSVFGGCDLKAGGTWMAFNRAGRLAALTNIRQGGVPPAGRSRGFLVLDALAAESVDALDCTAYAAFNLLVAQAEPLGAGAGRWRVDYLNAAGIRESLRDGLHGLSNASLNTGWPKTRYLQATLDDVLGCAEDRMMETALTALADRRIWPDDQLPSTGVPLEWERMLSACQIVSPAYGTRCSTVVRAHRSGRIDWHERTFGPEGQNLGDVAGYNLLHL